MWTLKRFIRYWVYFGVGIPRSISSWYRYWRSFWILWRISPSDRKPDLLYLQPCLGDDTSETTLDATYFYQDAWAFEKVLAQKPAWHVDVGSHNSYVSMLSKVIPVTMVDIRPLPVQLDSLKFRQGSILDMPYETASVPSVSSICVVEHIGLGRYGDPLDPLGTEKALTELKRIVQPGGYLYLSVPLDDHNRTYFNAHRALSESYLLNLLNPFHVVEKKYIHGTKFLSEKPPGFSVGCYQLRKEKEGQ